MKKLDILAAVLLVVGGLNWGLVGAGGPDLVALIFGAGSALARIVYLLVGLAAVYQAFSWKAIQRRWLHGAAAFGAAALLGLVLVTPLHAQSPEKPGTIVETAVAAGQFNTLVTAVKSAGLVETLNSKGPFTVFAPTDDAFGKLPEGTVPGLLKDKPALTSVLTYHVVAGRMTAADLQKRADQDGYLTLKTVQGSDLKLHLGKGKVHVGDKWATVVAADIPASNGVIHVIDGVLLPGK